MQVITIKNEWDRDIVIPHNGEKYTIRPGEQKHVPWDGAASLFGDPSMRDTEKQMARRDLYNHVRGLWNFHPGFDQEEVWERDLMPRFTATDLNTGEEVWFIIQDPAGKHSFNKPQSDAAQDAATINVALATLQAQVAQLTAALAAQAAADGAPTSQVPAPAVENAAQDTAAQLATNELPPVQPTTPKSDSPRTAPVKK